MSSTAASLLGCPDDGLWAITSYFNTMRYRRRSANYRIFRECLGVPLLVVELVYGLECELSEKDADILVQVRGGDIMWQKERLLNIGLRSLPSKCRKVAVVDCDIIFEELRLGQTRSRAA